MADLYPIESSEPVGFEVMRMKWKNLTFIHWPFKAEVVQKLLPPGIKVDCFDNKVWVGLIPFQMEIKLPGGIPLPREGYFPETNVRTYVIGPDGTPGVWFFSLEAGRLLASATARLTYGLPYFWAKMNVAHAGNIWTYTSTRKWPGKKGTQSEIVVETQKNSMIDEHSEFDRYLTARWRLYSLFRNKLVYAPVTHEAWPLQNAKLLHLDDELVNAAGLEIPAENPVVHWSKGVQVRIDRPRFAK